MCEGRYVHKNKKKIMGEIIKLVKNGALDHSPLKTNVYLKFRRKIERKVFQRPSFSDRSENQNKITIISF